jgi:competence protein ComEA
MVEWIEQKRGTIFFAVIALALGGLTLFQSLRSKPDPDLLLPATPVPTVQTTATPGPVRVYVSGAVQKPDVYRLTPDSIVKDALLAAGGATDQADLDRINLALPVADGQHIYVPTVGQEDLPVRPPSRLSGPDEININTADAAELETLPGIGPTRAQQIIDYRQQHGPFATIEEIMDVSGIGPATFEGLQDLITAD